MAALSLTEIRDAFAEESEIPDSGGFSGDTVPSTLPDHQKRGSLVGPRLVHDQETARIQKRAASRRSRRRPSQREHFSQAPAVHAGANGDLKRLVVHALATVSGLAIHHALERAMAHYFESNYTSAWNKTLIALTYPVTIILLLWFIRRH